MRRVAVLTFFAAVAPSHPKELALGVTGAADAKARRLTTGASEASESCERPAFIWFRGDLRLRDNPLLHHRFVTTASQAVPVYFLDPRYFALNSALHPKWLRGRASDVGVSKTGVFRARFILESLRDLQQKLRALGSDLIVLLGEPEEELPVLLKKLSPKAGDASVLCEHSLGTEEFAVETAVADVVQGAGARFKALWGTQTLYNPEDLPFRIAKLPEPFTVFRKAVEDKYNPVPVHKELPSPQSLPPFPDGLRSYDTNINLSDIDAVLHSLGFPDDEIQRRPDERVQVAFLGGEDAALARMAEFSREGLSTYKQTRNELVGEHFSSHLSPWLAHGCISPRTVYWAVKAFEGQYGATQDTYWLIFELMWRDWFRFYAEKYGKGIYLRSGPAGTRATACSPNLRKFERWRKGETGVDFVDANMKELMHTGFMSNRGRQNVASFLIFDLGVDWRLGAQWFEHALLDYDPASNYGNWVNAAGSGFRGQRLNRFNMAKQKAQYDPNNEFTDLWLGGSRSGGAGSDTRPEQPQKPDPSTSRAKGWWKQQSSPSGAGAQRFQERRFQEVSPSSSKPKGWWKQQSSPSSSPGRGPRPSAAVGAWPAAAVRWPSVASPRQTTPGRYIRVLVEEPQGSDVGFMAIFLSFSLLACVIAKNRHLSARRHYLLI